MNRMSLTRVPVGAKSSSPASPPHSNHGLFSTGESNYTSPREEESVWPPDPDDDLVSPLESNPPSPGVVKTATPKQKHSMAWDDPPKSSAPWHDTRTEAMGDLGCAVPSKDDSRHESRPMGWASMQSPPRRGDHPVEEPDQLDDDDMLYKRFSRPPTYCDSQKDVHRKKHNWLSLSILALSVYSTSLSCLWFIVAIVQPRWGPQISSSGGILPSTASLVCAMFAKTIEISFVTVFVTFIGQVLTRRAFVRKSKGMTLAEMTMRNWVIQPGFLITHSETLPYAGTTLLGMLSLIATVASTFYTTASDAMVAPKLKYGSWESKTLSGYVLASYANPPFARESCQTPLRDDDPAGVDTAGRACLEVQYAGQSYRNLMSFLGDWDAINRNGTSATVDISHRPVGTALLYDNTTLTSAWIEVEFGNTTKNFEDHGRIVNNVTLAMPHPSVYDAATNPANKILQPNDLSGVGEYAIKATVVSPALNVMCVNMSPVELAPLVYTEWPLGKINSNDTLVPGQRIGPLNWEQYVPGPSETEWLNRTAVDDVFRWGEQYNRRPPVFQLYPADFNMVTNTTAMNDAIYILSKSASVTNYTLCEMRSWVSPLCSTQFNISGTAGAHMQAHCEDPEDKDSYNHVHPEITFSMPVADWKNIADQWRLSMDINGGAQNNNASNARILTQFVLQEPQLNPLLPSMAEALAVYASSTLIIGGHGTPFEHYWRHEKMRLGAPGSLDPFQASIRTQEYTSGHVAEWQKAFYLVLVLVVVINVVCLAYFLARSGLVTDFTEPQNLFALAVNSPPSEQLKGSCGGGPVKRDLVVPWRVAYASAANHYFFEEASDRPWRGKYAGQDLLSADTAYRGRQRSSYHRLSTSNSWLSHLW
ncbi:MCM2/3/5 family protein [Colletotrichum tofieldiae]|uniref:MCM2/3/5 family protein n=1 Tax=Colletotrichum tofieldiae TaxID=708197 RepID=A0A166QJB6_9PEZI|nr:MCM2/3/5 family protein [Colletotrichum tofieldiae]